MCPFKTTGASKTRGACQALSALPTGVYVIDEQAKIYSVVDISDSTDIKQLLDEVEHNIVNYQNRGLCYLPKTKAEANNTDTWF